MQWRRGPGSYENSMQRSYRGAAEYVRVQIDWYTIQEYGKLLPPRHAHQTKPVFGPPAGLAAARSLFCTDLDKRSLLHKFHSLIATLK